MQGEKGVLSYLKGDATQPIGNDKKMIVHICNNSSHWGKGFVLALSKRWREPEKQFKQLKTYTLGEIQIIQVEANLEVVNMIAQNGIKKHYHPEGMRYVDYEALKTCLLKVGQYAGGKSVHICPGLAWDLVVEVGLSLKA